MYQLKVIRVIQEHSTLMKKIKVGVHVALIDDDDYDLVSQYTWCARKIPASRTIYAQTHINGDQHTTRSMHKLITGFDETDHINGNGLDNRRANLRRATRSQNMANIPKIRGSYSSQFKGVTWQKNRNKWKAQICVDYKQKHLGLFHDEIEAAKAYDIAAREAFGDFAFTNFSRDDRV